jgi:NAD(P)-dependent dehydrogenase (short-subunit alcohol dehydrogenase family)
MSTSLTWISGASAGIGAALAATVPWEGRVIGICRRPPEGPDGIEHLEADLADPSSWATVGESFRREMESFEGERVVLVHAAGTLDPIGFAGEVDTDAYAANVVLNSAAPQVLGHLFLAACTGIATSSDHDIARHLVMLTSGAARSIYPGWSSYGGAKAATDQWVRNVGAEQRLRGGARVLAVAPGTVDTDMQARMRATSEDDFPDRDKFVDLHRDGKLSDPKDVARRIWSLLESDLDTGAVTDLRQLTG